MYLAPEAEELEIAHAAAAFVADAMPIDRLHSPDCADMNPALRQLFGEMGWFALAVPESAGGSGLSAVEHALFFREVGRQCGPVDVLAQCLAANMAADGELKAQIVAGTRGVALLTADGDAHRVLGSVVSDLGLVVTPSEARLHPLAGLDTATRPSLDPANSMRLASELPDAMERVTGDHIWRLGQLGAAAMLVGIAEAALDLIVEYAKIRETFGRKIGSWQAVRHPCADMAVRVEAARSQLWYAAAAVKQGRADATVHLDVAKHMANIAALANTDTNIQLHGGIGVTDEHNAHLLLKHALLLSRLFGAKRMLLGRLLDARLED
ncbi:MAG: acyl-CoA dehydrogenase family protein [Sphingomonadales bacterium]|nr:acyl-CoA dehydrogenase family protein [Sphingomonadales bacterium]